MRMDEHQGRSAEQRLVDLESTLAHHQREFEQLNQVVIEQTGLLEKLQRRVERVEATLEGLMERLPDAQDASDEKPPHY